MIKQLCCYFLLLLSSSVTMAGDIFADGKRTITGAEIAEAGFGCIDCIDWKVVGVCFWLKCKLFSCSIEESIKYGHFIPDLVVSSYSGPDGPWTETAELNNAPNAGMTMPSAKGDNGKETYLNFKNVDIVVNPGIIGWNAIGDTDYFCNSQSTIPVFPHFVSGYDPNWNDPGLERLYPQSIFGYPQIKAKRVGGLSLGIFNPYWAPVYPRCGWGIHPLDPINGAVAAFRASHILTNSTSLHVRVPISGDCGNRCWEPGPVKENDASENKFQMVFPVVEDSGKAIGGDTSWANGKAIIEQGYIWNLWRRYKCCDKKGQFFLFSVDWD